MSAWNRPICLWLLTSRRTRRRADASSRLKRWKSAANLDYCHLRRIRCFSNEQILQADLQMNSVASTSVGRSAVHRQRRQLRFQPVCRPVAPSHLLRSTVWGWRGPRRCLTGFQERAVSPSPPGAALGVGHWLPIGVGWRRCGRLPPPPVIPSL